MAIPPNSEFKGFFDKGSEHKLVGGYDIPPSGSESINISLFYDTDEKGFFVVRLVSENLDGVSTNEAGAHNFIHRIFRLSGEKLEKFFELNPKLRETAETILHQEGQ
jgi:hypothetical protein